MGDGLVMAVEEMESLSGCDHCGTMQEGVETYLVYLEITGEEKSMKLCPACFGRREESGIKIIRQLS